jgi:hypothetical protein
MAPPAVRTPQRLAGRGSSFRIRTGVHLELDVVRVAEHDDVAHPADGIIVWTRGADRNVIERNFNLLTQQRGIATRYDSPSSTEQRSSCTP